MAHSPELIFHIEKFRDQTSVLLSVQTTCSLHEILTRLVITEKLFETFSVINSRVNISCRERVFWPTKGTGGLQHHIFLIFDGKQHPKNIWFHGC
jgi:hypothetical protein